MGQFDRWGKQIPVQPGEYVVGCGHTAKAPLSKTRPDERNGWYWFEVAPPCVVSSPVGGNIESRWVVTCKACFQAAKRNVRRVEIREHWRIPETVPQHVNFIREHFGADRAAITEYLYKLNGAELFDVAKQIGLMPTGLGRR